MRYLLTLEYDGTDYNGWQTQNVGRSVQGAVEEAISKLSGEKVFLYSAGRTDAGVHAIEMPAHFDMAKKLTLGNITDGLNAYLREQKDSISVLRARRAPDDFHARFSCKQRSYAYRILNRKTRPALYGNYCCHVWEKLDVRAMDEAAKTLLGTHDFSSFRAANCYAKSPVKTIDEICVRRRGGFVELKISAKSFLYHQVRNIAGALIEVGTGHWGAEKFAEVLAARDRAKSAPTAPARGLFFEKALY
ncbi:MAG: tRNA pseudouridine(38-40) synthase TruA [Rickettsiales bacterium]|jgi:tRNA pseudouridine38-40 synthase|nr:tRNA pseudouridine(38-40) synthase TruA [Rickettsiales bacterium]